MRSLPHCRPCRAWQASCYVQAWRRPEFCTVSLNSNLKPSERLHSSGNAFCSDVISKSECDPSWSSTLAAPLAGCHEARTPLLTALWPYPWSITCHKQCIRAPRDAIERASGTYRFGACVCTSDIVRAPLGYLSGVAISSTMIDRSHRLCQTAVAQLCQRILILLAASCCFQPAWLSAWAQACN